MSGVEGEGLAETLRRLAEALPERVRAEMGGAGMDEPEPWVFQYLAKHRGWQPIWWGGDTPAVIDLAPLEYALREECMKRGWTIGLDIRSAVHVRIQCAVVYTPQFHSAHADTPAHALALAVLQALS